MLGQHLEVAAVTARESGQLWCWIEALLLIALMAERKVLERWYWYRLLYHRCPVVQL